MVNEWHGSGHHLIICKLQHVDNFVEEFNAHERKEELKQKYPLTALDLYQY